MRREFVYALGDRARLLGQSRAHIAVETRSPVK